MRKSSLWAVLGSLPSLQGQRAWEARKELAIAIRTLAATEGWGWGASLGFPGSPEGL